MRTTVLGREIALPIIAPPTGLTGLMHPDGEAAIARAAHAVGTIYTQSALSSLSIEEVHAAAPGPKWFQLYVMTDRGLMRDMLARAQAAGHEALVLTVDVAVAGVRERDVRNRFSVPPRITVRALARRAHPPALVGGLRRPAADLTRQPARERGRRRRPRAVRQPPFDPTVTWDDLATLREHWDGPAGDQGDHARRRRASARSSTASTRSSSPTTAAASSTTRRRRSRRCPAVADAVGDRAELYLDSGVRRGTDIIKALALGARAVIVGRPLVYGLGAAGEAGRPPRAGAPPRASSRRARPGGLPADHRPRPRRSLREVAFVRLPVRRAGRALGVLAFSGLERRLGSERRGAGTPARRCWT